MNEMYIAKITIDICDNNNNTISSINNIKLYILQK